MYRAALRKVEEKRCASAEGEVGALRPLFLTFRHVAAKYYRRLLTSRLSLFPAMFKSS